MAMPAEINPNKQFGQALPFRPGPDLPELDRSLDRIPRYLFRLYVPKSNGFTDETVVESPAASSPKGNADFLQMPRDQAASMLWNHLKWISRGDDNLMSWTSSLSFVIQYGLYRHRTDVHRPDHADTRICIIDTRKFPRGTFVKDLDLLRTFANQQKRVESFLNNLRLGPKGYYFGEYLSQGRLDIEGRSRHTSLRLLLDMGLYGLEPRFETEQYRWASRIVELRIPFDYSPSLTCPASKEQVRKAITAAQAAFGDEYALPVALMLLSLCPRPRKDRAILSGFEATFTDEEIARLSLHTLAVDGERLPEVQQFAEMAYELRQHLAREGSVFNPFLVDSVYPETAHDLHQRSARQGSPFNPFLVDNLYPRLANPALPIDLTQLDDVTSSMSSLTVSQKK